ncbi:carboxypeptidase-like regulatory domain-containing protein [Pedobacter montanisoli]|uniref:Carboxypeptidase-like regulatory domain-containing protein n=1 Tax=Pedobacter montanisoli TaxID=2923277 RepID=A0ABS9ZT32_9SPHI|nr:carboxypeptidase-like regulatory domain-containing protein [Pedobacter montanisoli]MCJ0741537.1 carboxypeptidase-like regulatory domain-containing protein [Pedobacter montanisoli]
MRYILTILLFCVIGNVFAQDQKQPNKLVQFSGIVTDADSNMVVPYVTITNLSKNNQKYAANYQGYFSFVVNPGDTLLFSAVGFTSKKLVLPQIIADNKYTTMVQIKSEVISLQTVRVYPWATTEEFTRDFLSLKIADDDMAIAKKNLSKQSINGMLLTLPRDAQEISNSNYRYNFDRMVNANMRQTNPLLNPFAWGKLMQEIFKGDKARSTDQ